MKLFHVQTDVTNVTLNVRLLWTDLRKINLSCRHPKGPGNPVHCIYFRNNDRS